MGEVMQLDFGSGQDRFDGNPKPHYHFRCQCCGQVSDVPMPLQPALDREAAAYCQDAILGHRLEFYGLCAACQANDEKKE